MGSISQSTRRIKAEFPAQKSGRRTEFSDWTVAIEVVLQSEATKVALPIALLAEV